MNISNRLRKLEQSRNNRAGCQCAENTFATSTEDFDERRNCRKCGNIINPSVLVVTDLSEIENFNHPVKVYAGIDINLV